MANISVSSSGAEQVLVKQDSETPMDLSGVTSPDTNIIGINQNPSGGQTSLIEGSITRIGNKAFCFLQLRTDDQSRFDLEFGSSIIPVGSEIITGNAIGTINQDNFNLRREGNTTLSIDIAGTNADQVINIDFWVDNYPLFEDYILEEVL